MFNAQFSVFNVQVTILLSIILLYPRGAQREGLPADDADGRR